MQETWLGWFGDRFGFNVSKPAALAINLCLIALTLAGIALGFAQMQIPSTILLTISVVSASILGFCFVVLGSPRKDSKETYPIGLYLAFAVYITYLNLPTAG